MNNTDRIAAYVLELLDNAGGVLEFSRGDLAQRFGCAPSVVTYTVQSRFTPERGYRIEGRRSRGGCIRVVRLPLSREALTEHILAGIGDELSLPAALALAEAIEAFTGRETADMLRAAASIAALGRIPPEYRSKIRADIIRQMIAHLA